MSNLRRFNRGRMNAEERAAFVTDLLYESSSDEEEDPFHVDDDNEMDPDFIPENELRANAHMIDCRFSLQMVNRSCFILDFIFLSS